jgi:hypothetical protein
MRLGVLYLQDCEINIDSHNLPDKVLEMIPKNITSMEISRGTSHVRLIQEAKCNQG